MLRARGREGILNLYRCFVIRGRSKVLPGGRADYLSALSRCSYRMSQYDAAVTERPIVLAEVSNSASSDLRFTNSPQQSEPMQQEPIHPENEDLEKD